MMNAFIVFNSIPSNSKMTSLKFRQAVIQGLLHCWDRDQTRTCIGQRSIRQDLPSRLTERGHFPGRVSGASNPDLILDSYARNLCELAKYFG